MREDRGSGLSRISVRMFFFSLQSNGKPRVTNISQFFAEIELSNVFENFVKTFLPTYICRFYSEISQVSVKCLNVEKFII